MKQSLPLFVAVALCVCPLTKAATDVRDLNPQGIIGRLGKPLGTRLTIDGVLAKQVMLTNPLAVSKVAGQTLKETVSIEIRGRVQIQKDVEYRLEGYEAGEFSGAPPWLGPGVQQPFQFRSFFVVTKVLEPEAK